MKPFLKRLWKLTKVCFGIVLILSIVLFAIRMILVLFDRTELTNTVTMSSITIVIAIASIPGILSQFFSLFRKKKIILNTPCPHCNQNVHWTFEEEYD